MTMGERIKKLRIARGYTQIEFAKMLGITQAQVSQYESDINTPRPSMLKKIAKVLNISTEELSGFYDLYFYDIEQIKKEDLDLIKVIPVFSVEVSAGNGVFPETFCPEEVITIPNYKNVDYAFKVTGDSMAPILNKGDIILIKATPEAYNGDMIVALFDNLLVVKWFVKKADNIILVPENREYPPLIPIAGIRFQIIGIVEKIIAEKPKLKLRDF